MQSGLPFEVSPKHECNWIEKSNKKANDLIIVSEKAAVQTVFSAKGC
jgi:hypothetical protein